MRLLLRANAISPAGVVFKSISMTLSPGSSTRLKAVSFAGSSTVAIGTLNPWLIETSFAP